MKQLFACIWLCFLLSYVPELWHEITHQQPAHAAPLTQADKGNAPRTKYTDDIDSFVTYDVAPKDRAAALLGAQRAVSWMENHGAIDYFPPSEGDSP